MTTPPPGPAETPEETQARFLESSLDLVFAAFDEAANGAGEPTVVLLLDCEDEIGGEIARSWLGNEAVDDAIAHQPADETALFAYGFPLSRCVEEVPRVFPYLAPVFEEPSPSDGFLTVVVASGGAAAFTVPASARP